MRESFSIKESQLYFLGIYLLKDLVVAVVLIGRCPAWTDFELLRLM
jgi:hypothetical protein